MHAPSSPPHLCLHPPRLCSRDLEVEGLDLDTDVVGNETRSLDRAVKLVNALNSMELRTDVLNWIGPEVWVWLLPTEAGLLLATCAHEGTWEHMEAQTARMLRALLLTWRMVWHACDLRAAPTQGARAAMAGGSA